MSDFTNYIRVAIQGLSENTPLARASAYERVRKGIRRQLESRSASEAEVNDTLEELENAILDMEAEQLMHPTPAAEPAAPAEPPQASIPQEPAKAPEPAAPAYRPDSNVTPIGRRPAEAPAREYAYPKITETPAAPAGQGGDAPRAPEAPAEAAPPPPMPSTPSYSPQRTAVSGAATTTQALKVEASDRDLLEEFQSALTAELAMPISAEEEARSKPKPEPAAPAIEEPAPVAEPAPAAEPEIAETPDDTGFDVKILLRKAVSNEDMRDPATREIIYRRARNALVKYLKTLSPQPDFDAVHTHIEKLNAAIRDVEAEQALKSIGNDDADTGPSTDELMSELSDIWSSDYEQPASDEPAPQPRAAKPSRPVAKDIHRTIADEMDEAVQELADMDPGPEPSKPAPRPNRSIDDEVEEAVQELIAADFVRDQAPKKSAAPKKPEKRKVRPAPVAAAPEEDFELDADFAVPSGEGDRKQPDRWATDDDFELPEDMFGDDFAFEEPAERVAANQDQAPKAPPRRRGGFGRFLAILLVLLVGGGIAAAFAFPEATARYTAEARTTGTWLAEFVAGLAGEPSRSADNEGESETASAMDANTQESEPAGAAQEQPAATETAGASEAASDAAPAVEETVEEPAAGQAMAPVNGEKAFLFATSGGQPVVAGNVEWSVIESSPQPGMPAEPAIRGDVAIPSDGLRATLTLRRNLDETLPATHLFELVFAPSDGVASSEVASVEAITFVQSGQDRAEPLVGSVVKIADNIFLFALADVPEARQRHDRLFSDPDLIEIQFVYYSGRRTTLRLVTGETGGRAFATATQAWGSQTAAAPAPAAPEPAQPEPMTPPETTALETPAEPEADTPETGLADEGQQTETSAAQTGRPVIPDNVPIPPDRPLFDG